MTTENDLDDARTLVPGELPPGKCIHERVDEKGVHYFYYQDSKGDIRYITDEMKRFDAQMAAAQRRHRECYMRKRH